MVCEKLIVQTVERAESPWHIIFFILNIFFPGSGTISAGICGRKVNWKAVLVGLLQFFLAFVIIGWIWSIWWGYLIYETSSKSKYNIFS